MTIRILLAVLSVTSLIWGDDAPRPPTKKEFISAIPHLWVSEGILYMKARESHLSFANQPRDISNLNFTNTSVINPHFKWNTGIQINLGFQPKTQYYFASWCYIRNTAHGSQSTNGTEGFFPVLSMNRELTPASFVTSANANWRLRTQLADGGTLFPWKPWDFFLLKTEVGLRIASLNQKLKAYYGGGIFSEGTDVLTLRNNFLGIGPIVGILPTFFLPGGLSLCGEFTASGLLGRFYVKQKESYLSETLFHKTNVMTRFRLGFDAKAYLAWQKELLYKSIILSAQIGWEWHEFFHQNQLQQNAFHLSKGQNNIYLNGGFFSLCMAF
jgi:hypothetical protein